MLAAALAAQRFDAFPLPGDTEVIETSERLNQLATQYPGMGTLEHDANGNITRLGSATYKYTSENRLAEKGVDVALVYDPVGRLAYTGPFEGGGTYRDYVGTQLIGEAGHTRLRSYVPGPGTDEVLTWYEFPTSGPALRRWLLQDERGSTVGVTDATGAVIGRLSYNDYGTPAATNPASVRFQYTGQQWLPELGMHYYKNRIYYPQIGRFMQTDPIGVAGGVNLYAYVGGDPINRIDPLGLVDEIVVTGRRTPDVEFRFGDFERYDFGRRFYAPDFLESEPGALAGSLVALSLLPQKHKFVITRKSACSPNKAFNGFKQAGYSAPGAPAAREGFTQKVDLAGGNPISQNVNSATRTIVNTTLMDHVFYPGDVTIQVDPLGRGGSQITITGTGTGSFGSVNNAVGNLWFGTTANAVALSCSR